MPEVIVDGTRYMPAHSIGVAVTTHNRYDTFKKSLAELRRLSPGIPVVVVDDGSKTPVPEADFRFDQPQGIARAKNKCLELLDGAEHLFLFDDDTYPLVTDWWKPYVDSPEPHLMRIFEDLTGPKKLKDITRIGGDDKHVAYSGSRGVMLYVHRSVVDRVGGLDPVYGRWGYEHPDYSNRVHNAGLTTWRYADVTGSDQLIYCLDEHDAVERSVPSSVRQAATHDNAVRCNTRYAEGYDAFVPFRSQRDVVLTSYLTGEPDPQRGTRLPSNASALKAWTASIRDGLPVVLTDCLDEVPGAEVARVAPHKGNVYFVRWQHARRWLLDHPEVRWCWITDGTDVVMQHRPWTHMQPGTLYAGYEPTVVENEWLRKSHPSKLVHDFIDAHGNETLLNAGVLGGDRDTVLTFLHALLKAWQDQLVDEWHKKDKGVGVGDMALFNIVARRFPVEFGPRITTLFKHNERNSFSFWAHK